MIDRVNEDTVSHGIKDGEAEGEDERVLGLWVLVSHEEVKAHAEEDKDAIDNQQNPLDCSI